MQVTARGLGLTGKPRFRTSDRGPGTGTPFPVCPMGATIRAAVAHGADARILAAEADRSRAEARGYAAWQGNPELDLIARASASRRSVEASSLRAEAGRAAVGAAAGASYLDAVRARERAELAGPRGRHARGGGRRPGAAPRDGRYRVDRTRRREGRARGPGRGGGGRQRGAPRLREDRARVVRGAGSPPRRAHGRGLGGAPDVQRADPPLAPEPALRPRRGRRRARVGRVDRHPAPTRRRSRSPSRVSRAPPS